MDVSLSRLSAFTAQAAGDPHLVTLDNLSYTFNGEGDFVLLQDISGRIAVHVQASRAQDTEGEGRAVRERMAAKSSSMTH